MQRTLLGTALVCATFCTIFCAMFFARANAQDFSAPRSVTAEQLQTFDQDTSDEQVAHTLVNRIPLDASISELVTIWQAAANAMVVWQGQGFRAQLLAELFDLTAEPNEQLADVFFPMYEQIHDSARADSLLSATLIRLSETSEERRQQAFSLCFNTLTQRSNLQALNSTCAISLAETTSELEQLTDAWQQLNSQVPIAPLLAFHQYATALHPELLQDFNNILLQGNAFNSLDNDGKQTALVEWLRNMVWAVHAEGASVDTIKQPLLIANELLQTAPDSQFSLNMAAINHSLSEEVLQASPLKRRQLVLSWLNEQSALAHFLLVQHADLSNIFAINDFEALIESTQLKYLQAAIDQLQSLCYEQSAEQYGYSLSALQAQLFEQTEGLLFGLYDNRYLPLVEELESIEC